MKNIQISFDEDILAAIDRAVSTGNLSFPDIVKDAVRQWLKRREIRKFEEDWIEKLKSEPDNPEDAEKWIPIQYRSDDESW
jgi:Arc/MetJ-type ribon-helix-helix transcriptional regulator